jgi:hypothetical protein
MNVLCLLLVFGLAAGGLAESRAVAEEAAGDLDSVLAKWEEASQKCQSLDANLTVYRYDDVFRDRTTTMQGRFYYEAPNKGRYEIRRGDPAKPNDWSEVSEVTIWTGDEVLWIDGNQRTCRRLSLAQLPKLDELPIAAGGGSTSSGLFGFAARMISFVYRRMLAPKDFLPLTIDILAAEVRERFSVTIARVDGVEIELRALPKRSPDTADYCEIDVILNAKTYMTYAVQTILPGGRERLVCVLNDQKVNHRPADRDQLLNPDLSGLRVTVLDATPPKSPGSQENKP